MKYTAKMLLELLGADAYKMYEQINNFIMDNYNVNQAWDNAGKHEGICLRYRCSGKTLCTLYFRPKYLGIWIIFGTEERNKFEKARSQFSSEIQKKYDSTEAYHDGKWLRFDIEDNRLFDEIVSLLAVKKSPDRKLTMRMSNVYDKEEFFQEYAKMDRSRKGLEGAGEWHQLKPLFPDLKGKKVLDLGCGYGWHCKYAIECGADSVLGIDLSEKMIAAAKEKNADERIHYQVCGLDKYGYPEDTFDFVVSNLVLHYIEELNEIYKYVYRTLRKNGSFLFNIEHPVFTGSVNQDWIYDKDGRALYWPVDNYFYPGLRRTNFLGKDVTKQHHTFTQIINGLLQCGFSIEVVEEAMPDQSMMDIPGMKDEMRRPMMLLVKVTK